MTVNEIIENWVNLIPNKFKIQSITDNGDNTSTLYTCNTAWSLINHSLTIDNISYTILEVDRDVSIKIEGVPTVLEFTLDIPFFAYGTPRAVNTERQYIRENGTTVTPMIYLFASIEENVNHDPTSNTDKTINFLISFLNDYQENQFTDDIIDYSVKAMRKLSDAFINTMKSQIMEVKAETLTQRTTEYPKYAQTFTKSGGTNNIFSENLSGVENNLTISLKKQNNCVNLCNS